MKNTKLIMAVIVGLMVVVGGGMITKSIKNNVPSINKLLKTDVDENVINVIKAKVMGVADLIPVKTEVTGTVEYEKYEEKFGPDAYAKYSLTYTQYIEARINLLDLSVEKSFSKFIIRMPNPVIQYNEPKVTSFILIDKSFVRSVSMSEKEMLLEAEGLIPDDVKKRVNLNDMKNIAKKRAQDIIRDIIKDLDKNNKYGIEIEFFS